MKVDTPQILWHSEEEKGLSAALMGVSLLQSGIDTSHVGANPTQVRYGNVLATAGNTKAIHLWKVLLPDGNELKNSRSSGEPASAAPTHPNLFIGSTSNPPSKADTAPTTINSSDGCALPSSTKIEFLFSLDRHDGPVNAVSFSPDGLHLATASEAGGTIIVWSVPPQQRGNDNGRHFWASAGRENALNVKILHAASDGVTDLSWSADSSRFTAGSIDHSVMVFELERSNNGSESWRPVYRNAMDHAHYVQGVSYDPLGVYLASMSSDRSVRLWSRKPFKKGKIKKLLQPTQQPASTDSTSTSTVAPTTTTITSTTSPTATPTSHTSSTSSAPTPRMVTIPSQCNTHDEAVQTLLADSKFEMMARSKELRRWKLSRPSSEDNLERKIQFADESTLQSFVRRLSWTTDGAFLVVPAAVVVNEGEDSSSSTQSFASLMFARHAFDEPCRILGGLEHVCSVFCFVLRAIDSLGLTLAFSHCTASAFDCCTAQPSSLYDPRKGRRINFNRQKQQ